MPGGVATPSAVLDSSTSSSTNGTTSTVTSSDTSSTSVGVTDERPAELPPAGDSNWVEVQRRKKGTRGESKVS